MHALIFISFQPSSGIWLSKQFQSSRPWPMTDTKTSNQHSIHFVCRDRWGIISVLDVLYTVRDVEGETVFVL